MIREGLWERAGASDRMDALEEVEMAMLDDDMGEGEGGAFGFDSAGRG